MAFTVVSITMGWVGDIWVLTWDFAVIVLLMIMICLRKTLSGFYIVSICIVPLASLVEAVSRRMLLVWLETRRSSSKCRLHMHLYLSFVKMMATRCMIRRTSLITHYWWTNAAKLGLYWVANLHNLVVVLIILVEILLFLNFFVFFIARLTLVFGILFCHRRTSPASSTSKSSFLYRWNFICLKLWLILFLQATLLNLGNSLIHAPIAAFWLLMDWFWGNTLTFRTTWGLIMTLRTWSGLFRE